MSAIEVRCGRPGDAGPWRCEVDVDDGRTSGRHVVTVPPPRADQLDRVAVERLVRETFVFLLEREPRSSILAAFDLAVVARYFPEFETEIARRFGG